MQTEREIKVRLTTNQQVKLFLRDGSLENVMSELRRGLEMTEFTFHPSVWLMVDEYFDTPDLLLYRTGYSLRKRRFGDEFEGTLKIPQAASTGVLQRGEIEEDLLSGGGWPREILTALQASPLRIDMSTLALQCVVESKRIKILAAKDPVVLELSIDEFVAKRWGLSSEPQCELEIEEKTVPGDFRLDAYKDRLQRFLGAELGDPPVSKYERAIQLWQLDRPRPLQLMARLARSPYLTQALAVIGVVLCIAAWMFPRVP